MEVEWTYRRRRSAGDK